MRNRIIAVVVLVVLVILLVSMISCVARAFGGGGDQSASTTTQEPMQVQQGDSSAQAASSSDSSAQSASASSTDSGEGVEDPWTENGRFSTGDSELDELVKAFCDEHSDSSKSAAENAKNAYQEAVWRDYVEDDTNQEPVGPDWDIEYAKQSLKKGSGNCYEFAAVDEYILKYFGYSDAQAEPCLVLKQSGDWGDHGLTFVTDTDGRKCMLDSSFGANGWMLDADSYSLQLVDVGQDESEFTVANFEEITKANWLRGGTSSETSADDEATTDEAADDEEEEDA